MLKLCHHRQVFFSLILLLAVGVFAPGVASAQDATIAGTVADTTGGILPGVTVDARDAAGRSQVTVTDGTGQFTFSGLAPGTYAVTFIPLRLHRARAGGRCCTNRHGPARRPPTGSSPADAI